MKKCLIILAIVFVLNIIFTGLLQDRIKRVHNQINSIEISYNANLTKQSLLNQERQDNIRRERIINYAQTNLGMELLKPDVIASGKIIKEIHEDYSSSKNIIYSFIDFITPSMNAYELKK